MVNMKRINTFVAGLAALVSLLFLTACDINSGTDDEPNEIVAERVTDFAADPFVGFVDGRPVGTGKYAFFSLQTGLEIDAADSASTAWDIALQGTDMIVNGGSSGPGQGGAQVVEGIFEEIMEAPATGWVVDSDQGTAIVAGSGNGWYNYNPASMVVSPMPGRVLLIRTADGRFAKIKIISYYRGAPETPTAESEARFYTFDYVFQPDGSRSFL